MKEALKSAVEGMMYFSGDEPWIPDGTGEKVYVGRKGTEIK